MSETITFERKFCGPKDSANGGFAAGSLARFVQGTASVTLHKPPPLNTPLTINPSSDGTVSLTHEDEIVAKAQPAPFDLDVPQPPTIEEAIEAATRSTRFGQDMVFPTCFVCGPHRHDGAGLRIFAGIIEERNIATAPWTPSPELPLHEGKIAPEIVWAALDCPGAFAPGAPVGTKVLGRIATKIDRAPAPSEACIVISWPIDTQGRKFLAGTALCTEAGEVLARAKATWIRLRTVQNK